MRALRTIAAERLAAPKSDDLVGALRDIAFSRTVKAADRLRAIELLGRQVGVLDADEQPRVALSDEERLARIDALFARVRARREAVGA